MQIEIRSAEDATISGYVNAVDRRSRIMHLKNGQAYEERVLPGTFRKAIEGGGSILLKFNHGRVIGESGSGSLELREDNIGLFARAHVTDPEIIEKARKKELRGWSFGFVPVKDSWNTENGALWQRSLSEIELREVSILDKTPAYIATSIEMRDGKSAGAGKARATVEYKQSFDEIEIRELAKNDDSPSGDTKNTKNEKENNLNFEALKNEIELLKNLTL